MRQNGQRSASGQAKADRGRQATLERDRRAFERQQIIMV